MPQARSSDPVISIPLWGVSVMNTLLKKNLSTTEVIVIAHILCSANKQDGEYISELVGILPSTSRVLSYVVDRSKVERSMPRRITGIG